MDKPPAQASRGVKLTRIWLRRLREPLLTVLLGSQIFILFLMPALRAGGVEIPRIAVTGTLVAFAALVCVVSCGPRAIVMMATSVVLTVVGGIWRHGGTNLTGETISVAGQVLAQLTVMWVVAAAVFGAGPITHHRILGAVVMYLSIGMIFTSLYILVVQMWPGAFTHLPTNPFGLRETLTYFSFGTLTTSSFGDVLPIHPIARSLTNVEAICGQLFPATLLARIVGLQVTKARKTVSR